MIAYQRSKIVLLPKGDTPCDQKAVVMMVKRGNII